MISRANAVLLDVFTFVLHLAIVVMLLFGAGFLAAPLFGVEPPPEKIVQAVFFAACAIMILVLDIKLMAKRRFRSYLAVFGMTSTALLMWCLVVSAYDMSKVVMLYFAVGIPLLIVKRRIDNPSRTTPPSRLPPVR